MSYPTEQRWRKKFVSLTLVYSYWAHLGVIAKSVMHAHMTIFWTIVLGILGSIIGGGVTHMFSRPANEQYHPAGLIFSTLGAILILFICYKLKIHFPAVNPF
jgi:uncharacterized membrane protein YeaQ/YmgE (transglycosylase-associated protein family)